MRYSIFLFLNLCFLLNIVQAQNEDYYQQLLENEFKSVQYVALTDTIVVDLNGDEVKDYAVFTTDNDKKGVLIIDGKTGEETRIGLGVEFLNIGDNLGWVEYWGILYDKETYEIKENEDGDLTTKKWKLQNPSIVLRQEEVGGGVIAFLDGKYVWLCQAD